jgi:hypothetical protein
MTTVLDIENNHSYITFKNGIIIAIIVFVIIRYYQRVNNKNNDKTGSSEGFTNMIGSSSNGDIGGSNIIYQAFPFESYYELKDTNYPVIKRSYVNLPVLRFNTNYQYKNNKEPRITYNDKIGNYMKKHIFPLQDVNTYNTLDTILKLINSELDIAFLNEELLYKYIFKNEDLLNLIPGYTQNNNKSISLFEEGYENINFSVVASCYFSDLFFITYQGNPLNRLSDINSSITIGCTPESSIFLKKIISANQFTNPSIFKYEIMETNEEIIEKFNKNDIEYVFLMIHTKDNYLIDLTFDRKVKFIHLSKNINEINNTGIGNNNNIDDRDFVIEQSLTAAEFYNHIRSSEINQDMLSGQLNILNEGEEKENFTSILKRYIPNIYSRVIDLNSFYPSDNDYSYLETYSVRNLLVVRNDLDQKYIDILINNFIKNLNEIKYKLVENDYILSLENFNNYDLNIEELLVFNNKIPLHEKVKSKYKDIGLLKIVENVSCPI